MTSFKHQSFINIFACILGFLALNINARADTIDHYMNIANNIPKMEMKADEQAQAWARSARNVLAITCESILETMMEMNNIAGQQGKPLFCPSNDAALNAQTLNQLIQQTAKEMSSMETQQKPMTVSQVAWIAVKKQFPCNGGGNASGSSLPFQQLSNIGIHHQSGIN